MKIVHSFWSKPALKRDKGNEKINGGWRHEKYNYMSWALSCLSFKKQYKNIELVTDAKGKKLLVDTLKLPYTSVRVELDVLNHYPSELWAAGKLFAYSLQNEPFIHVDGDVYVWQKFKKELESAPLIGQHLERVEGHYNYGINQIRKHGFSLLPEFEKDFQKQKKFNATNAGILGGNNVDFFKEYVERAFWFINKNLHKMDATIIGANYALIYEQYLFSVLARIKKIKVHHYIEDNGEDIGQVTNFKRKYGENKFVHLLGESKTVFANCRELEMQLRCEYPEYHENIMDFLNTNNG
jgi:uncharacterized protein DUF6734